MIRVEVPVPGRSYETLVGRGVLTELASLIPARATRAAIVTQPDIGVTVDPGIDHRVFDIADGEGAKSMSTIEMLCRSWATWGLTRADVVVAVGGGVVTDTAGFAAASYHRGIDVVHVPTSLLAMIDAAIGGKTGVNLPEGKNLVGAFWQPQGVLCDLDTLETLPPRELRSGLGELAKYRFLPGGEGLEDLDLAEQVARCVEIKAAVVAADEREGGRRAILNYGHTLAHAIETAGTYDLRHGEAVAVGLHYAAVLGERLGRIDAARVDEHRAVLGHYDLPMRLPGGLSDDDLVTLMGRDKKAVDGLTFALDGPDGVEIVAGVDPEVARDALGGGPMTGTILLLSGPNLNLLGEREPEIYGTSTLDDHVQTAMDTALRADLHVEHLQSNHEGELIDAIHHARHRCVAIVVNAGALTHYAWAIHDALAAFDGPVVELHLSDPKRREEWRHVSVVEPVADAVVAGLGGDGYRVAIETVRELLDRG